MTMTPCRTDITNDVHVRLVGRASAMLVFSKETGRGIHSDPKGPGFTAARRADAAR